MDRFWSKVDKTDSCWLWTASTNHHGYGQFWLLRSMRLAHRVAWSMERGPVPDGLQLDHLCRVRHCVNPAHMELVTPGENVRRGDQVGPRATRRFRKRDIVAEMS